MNNTILKIYNSRVKYSKINEEISLLRGKYNLTDKELLLYKFIVIDKLDFNKISQKLHITTSVLEDVFNIINKKIHIGERRNGKVRT